MVGLPRARDSEFERERCRLGGPAGQAHDLDSLLGRWLRHFPHSDGVESASRRKSGAVLGAEPVVHVGGEIVGTQLVPDREVHLHPEGVDVQGPDRIVRGKGCEPRAGHVDPLYKLFTTMSSWTECKVPAYRAHLTRRLRFQHATAKPLGALARSLEGDPCDREAQRQEEPADDLWITAHPGRSNCSF